MYNSGDAAEQVVRISLEGTEVALKLTGSAAKNIAAMLYAVWKNRDKNKTKGHQRLSAMLKSGKELKVFTVSEEHLKQFALEAKRYSEQGFKYYHFTRAESAEDFDDYIAQCKALSLYDTGITAEYGDRLITLSTCEYSRKNGRMVVVAKRIAVPSTEVDSDA